MSACKSKHFHPVISLLTKNSHQWPSGFSQENISHCIYSRYKRLNERIGAHMNVARAGRLKVKKCDSEFCKSPCKDLSQKLWCRWFSIVFSEMVAFLKTFWGNYHHLSHCSSKECFSRVFQEPSGISPVCLHIWPISYREYCLHLSAFQLSYTCSH